MAEHIKVLVSEEEVDKRRVNHFFRGIDVTTL